MIIIQIWHKRKHQVFIPSLATLVIFIKWVILHLQSYLEKHRNVKIVKNCTNGFEIGEFIECEK